MRMRLRMFHPHFLNTDYTNNYKNFLPENENRLVISDCQKDNNSLFLVLNSHFCVYDVGKWPKNRNFAPK